MNNHTNTTKQFPISEQFTLTEFHNRIRPLARRCAQMEGINRAAFEIDIRLIPVATNELPTRDEAFPEGDDLDGHLRINDKKGYLQKAGVLQHGAVVHLRVYDMGEWGELRNVFTLWMGTPEADAIIIDAPAFEADVNLI